MLLVITRLLVVISLPLSFETNPSTLDEDGQIVQIQIQIQPHPENRKNSVLAQSFTISAA